MVKPNIEKQKVELLKIFNSVIAQTLKKTFPELGTQKEMNGSDTVEALCELYEEAKNNRIGR